MLIYETNDIKLKLNAMEYMKVFYPVVSFESNVPIESITPETYIDLPSAGRIQVQRLMDGNVSINDIAWRERSLAVNEYIHHCPDGIRFGMSNDARMAILDKIFAGDFELEKASLEEVRKYCIYYEQPQRELLLERVRMAEEILPDEKTNVKDDWWAQFMRTGRLVEDYTNEQNYKDSKDDFEIEF